MIHVLPRESERKETERLIERAAICGLYADDSEKERGLMIKQILRNQLLIMEKLGVGDEV